MTSFPKAFGTGKRYLSIYVSLAQKKTGSSPVVEIIGFEPMTSCMPCKRSSQLSYTPILTTLLQPGFPEKGRKYTPGNRPDKHGNDSLVRNTINSPAFILSHKG